MNKCMKIILCALLSVVCAAGIGLWAMVRSVDRQIFADLSALNLPGVWVYRDMAMQSGEGFSAFVMPHYKSHNDPVDLRQEALAAMSSAEGWHVSSVEAAGNVWLTAELPLRPDTDTAYEAWFFRENGAYPDALPANRPDGDWTLCFFDADSGVFIAFTEASICRDGSALELAAIGLGGMETELDSIPVMHQTGDTRLTALTIPINLRSRVEAKISASDEWQSGEVTRAEFATLMNAVQEEVWPELYPAEGVTFDAWLRQDLDEPGPAGYSGFFPQAMREGGTAPAADSRHWRAAWYDVQSGLLVICERER